MRRKQGQTRYIYHSMQQDLEKEVEPEVIPPVKKPILQSQLTSKEYLQEYEKQLQAINLNTQFISQKLLASSIFYEPTDHHPFSYQIVKSFNSHEIVVLKVLMGGFTLNLRILNVDGNSPLSHLKPDSQGNFGKIFTTNFQGKEIVVKSIEFSHEEETSNNASIGKAIHQYCLNIICSVLQCGPRVQNYFGFDLILYNGSVEFALEKCQILTTFQNQSSQQLLQALKTLHYLKIVHSDINQDNIMFSESFRKCVFIDFGLSKVIQEEVGFKTWTGFCGTPAYVTKEMLRLLSKTERQGYVDLYYNDLNSLLLVTQQLYFALNSTEAIQKQERNRNIWLKKQEPQNPLPVEYFLVLLKYYCHFDQSRAKTVLKDNRQLLAEQNGVRLLKCLKSILPLGIASELILCDLKQLAYLREYSELVLILSRIGQNIPYSSSQFNEMSPSEQNLFQKRFILQEHEQSALDSITANPPSDLIKHLMDPSLYERIQDKTQFYSLLFDCIRFDRRNYDLTQKQKLAKAFLTSVCPEQQKTLNLQQMKPIQTVLKWLFNYCLTLPPSDWKTQNRIHIWIQAILTDTDIRAELQALQKWTLSVQCSYQHKLEIFMEYSDISGLLVLKHSFQQYQISKQIIQMVITGKQHIQNALESIECQSLTSQQREIISIYRDNTVNSLADSQVSLQLTELNSKLQVVKNESMKSKLKKKVMMNRLDYILQVHDKNEGFFAASEMMKKQFENNFVLEYDNFAEDLFWNHIWEGKYFNFNSGKLAILRFKSTINCSSIFDRLVLKFMLPYKPQALKTYIEELLIACFEHNRWSNFLSYFQRVLARFNPSLSKENRDLAETIAKKLVKFYFNFYCSQRYSFSPKKYITSLIASQWSFSYFFIIYAFLKRNSNFLPNSYFSQLLRSVRSTFWRCLNCQDGSLVSHFQTNFISIHYGTLLYDQAREEENAQKLIFNFKRQLQILNSETHFTAYRLFFLSLLTIRWENCNFSSQKAFKQFQTQKLPSLLVYGWTFLKINNSLLYYFFSDHKYIFAISETMSVLWNRNHLFPGKIFLFLEDIISQLNKRPLLQSILIFMDNITHFWFKNRLFFDHQNLSNSLGKITWQNRYCSILYAYCLLRDQSNKAYLKLIIELYRSIDLLEYNIRSRIVSICQFRILTQPFQISSARKELFVIHRLFLKYYLPFNHLDYSVFYLSFFRKQLKKKLRKKNLFNHILKKKITRFQKYLPYQRQS